MYTSSCNSSNFRHACAHSSVTTLGYCDDSVQNVANVHAQIISSDCEHNYLVRSAEVPIYGICFGHQIIAHAFGGRIIRSTEDSHFVGEVKAADGSTVFASFAHQEHVVDAGELDVVASAAHCEIAACQHPTRPIYTVQYHPEAVKEVLDVALACGDMSENERSAYEDQLLTTDVSIAFRLGAQ